MTNTAPDLSSLAGALAGARGKAVLVVGDAMLDRFTYGAVNRLSPETATPVPVLDIRQQQAMPGGAANVAANLRALGLEVRLAAVVGDDAAGRELAALCGFELVIDAARPTTVKTRFITAGGQLLRADSESRLPVAGDAEDRILAAAMRGLDGAAVVILSDYAKGVLTDRVIVEIIAAATARGVPVLADPKRRDFSAYAGVAAITPNRAELAAATGFTSLKNDADAASAARQALAGSGIDSMLLTRSEQGMTLFKSANSSALHLPAEAPAVVDVSGAGDTVIAALAAGIAGGLDLENAARLANRAAALAVMRAGTASVDTAELRGALAEIPAPAAVPSQGREAFVSDWSGAAGVVAAWRAQGLKVGFTNGCFDILHFGHVNYLARARDRCDRLVLGLNRDASVRILKGPERPLHDQDSRAAVIGALAAVDMVVFFGAEKAGEDNTPCALIECIRPDIFFKGGDYTIDKLPEAAVMKKIGGSVDIMPIYEGHSTTATLTRMKKSGAA